MIDDRGQDQVVNKRDGDQLRPERAGCFSAVFSGTVPFFVIFVIIGVRPEPEIGKNVVGRFPAFRQRNSVKCRSPLAFPAVSSDAGKNGDFVLVRACFAVVFDFLPYTVRVVYFLTEGIDSFDTQVRAVPVLNPLGTDVSAQAVHGFRFHGNGLRVPCVVFRRILNGNGM